MIRLLYFFIITILSSHSFSNLCVETFAKNQTPNSPLLQKYFEKNAYPEHQAFWLPKENAAIPDSLARARAKKVAEVENKIRGQLGYNHLNPTDFISNYHQYRGPEAEGRNPGNGSGKVWLDRGGPIIHIGRDVGFAEPQFAQFNSQIEVYFFDRGTDTISHSMPYREFVARSLEGDTVTLARIISGENRDGSGTEYKGWTQGSMDLLRKKNYSNDYDGYRGMPERGFHFAVGKLLFESDSHSYVKIDLPKEVLLGLAEKGQIEFGIIGVPMEAVVFESAWPKLLEQNIGGFLAN